jgi:hypothetical protein
MNNKGRRQNLLSSYDAIAQTHFRAMRELFYGKNMDLLLFSLLYGDDGE